MFAADSLRSFYEMDAFRSESFKEFCAKASTVKPERFFSLISDYHASLHCYNGEGILSLMLKATLKT
jgi:hypothetical protein